ncbi:MAG: type II toxin-antitoxin system HicA family toxin [Oscillospiraceae bacterium]
MKRRDLIKLLEQNGWTLMRTTGGHDIYAKGAEREPIPRHREVAESLAKAIIRRRGLK